MSLEVVRDAPLLCSTGPSPAAAVARVLLTLTDPSDMRSVREVSLEVFVGESSARGVCWHIRSVSRNAPLCQELLVVRSEAPLAAVLAPVRGVRCHSSARHSSAPSCRRHRLCCRTAPSGSAQFLLVLRRRADRLTDFNPFWFSTRRENTTPIAVSLSVVRRAIENAESFAFAENRRGLSIRLCILHIFLSP